MVLGSSGSGLLATPNVAALLEAEDLESQVSTPSPHLLDIPLGPRSGSVLGRCGRGRGWRAWGTASSWTRCSSRGR